MADCGSRSGEYEPHASGLRGLHVPETGIVDYKAVAAVWRDWRRIAAAP